MGQYVVVRTYSAGVHVGEMIERRGREVDLANARRIWSWKLSDTSGINSLHEVCTSGVGPGSRVSVQIPAITLLEAIEVLPCSEAAEQNLRAFK